MRRLLVLSAAGLIALGLGVVGTFLASPAGATGPDSESVPAVNHECGINVPHPPIQVTEDAGSQGFVLADGTPTYRPGSGVVAGHGTSDNPYVIAGWCIIKDHWEDTGFDAEDGIVVQNTSAHFNLQNNKIIQYRNGLKVEHVGADTVQMEGNVLSNNSGRGVYLVNSSGPTIRETSVTGNGHRGVHIVDSNDVTIHEATVTNNGGTGVHLSHSDNSTIRETTVTNNGQRGIHLVKSDDSTIHRTTVTGGVLLWRSDEPGLLDNELSAWNAPVDLFQSQGATIHDNNLIASIRGARLIASNHASIHNNTITDTRAGGIELHDSRAATLRSNTLGSGGLWIQGGEVSEYEHRIDGSNTANGQPLRYVRDNVNVTVAEPAGQVILVDTTNARVEGLDLRQTRVGVLSAHTKNTTVTNNSILDHSAGVGVMSKASSQTTIQHNNVTGNFVGIGLVSQSGATILNNNIQDNKNAGLWKTGDGEPINATNNWWGATNGPDGGIEDGCTGTIADGDGDSIGARDGSVCFDPWLQAPNQDAGTS